MAKKRENQMSEDYAEHDYPYGEPQSDEIPATQPDEGDVAGRTLDALVDIDAEVRTSAETPALEDYPSEEPAVALTTPVQENLHTSAKLVTNRNYKFMGKDYRLVETTGDQTEYYLVEKDLTDPSAEEQQIDTDRAIRPYDWAEELETLFPDIETVRRHALRSFYLAGAFDKEATKRREKNDMFNVAFPYRRQLLGE